MSQAKKWVRISLLEDGQAISELSDVQPSVIELVGMLRYWLSYYETSAITQHFRGEENERRAIAEARQKTEDPPQLTQP